MHSQLFNVVKYTIIEIFVEQVDFTCLFKKYFKKGVLGAREMAQRSRKHLILYCYDPGLDPRTHTGQLTDTYICQRI